jgi:hypothetical protein
MNTNRECMSCFYHASSSSYTARIYYQHDPERVATCPVTVHALLHVVDAILATGPVWATWSFPTERYCGKLQRAIHSRRYPFRNLDRFVLKDAALTHASLKFDLVKDLALSKTSKDRGDRFAGCACFYSSTTSDILMILSFRSCCCSTAFLFDSYLIPPTHHPHGDCVLPRCSLQVQCARRSQHADGARAHSTRGSRMAQAPYPTGRRFDSGNGCRSCRA